MVIAHTPANNSMQRTALRAAADAERYALYRYGIHSVSNKNRLNGRK